MSSAVMPNSRLGPPRSSSSRREKPRTDDNTPTALKHCRQDEIPLLAPRARKQHAVKVLDEWQTKFSRWSEIPDRPLDIMVVDSMRLHNSKLDLLEYLLFLSRPEEDQSSLVLREFVREAAGLLIITIDFGAKTIPETFQQPQAWVDHELWFDNEARSWTIPRQPDRILSISELDRELRPVTEPILTFHGHMKGIYRRLLYLADGDAASILALVRQATVTQSWALGQLLRSHFNTEPVFRLTVDVIPQVQVGTFFFNMPYLVLSKEKKLDARTINSRRLRCTYDLSCLWELGFGDNASAMTGPYMVEALMSVAINVRDDRWWEVLCLNDEFPFAESRLEADFEDDEEDITRTSLEIARPGEGPNAEARPTRSRSSTGLKPVRLDHFDPVLDSCGSYSHWDPRGYALNVVDNNLQRIVQCEETLFESIRKASRAYKNSRLINADEHQKIETRLSPEEIRNAIDMACDYMEKILDTVKQQEEECKNFLSAYLGVDKNRSPDSWVFRDPLFVGLNNKKDLRAMEYCVGLSYSIDRLHSLGNALEGEIESVIKLRDKQSKTLEEHRKVAEENGKSYALQFGLLHYVSHALVVIPLSLYNVPSSVTNLPTSANGLTGVILVLLAAFLSVPLLLWGLIKLVVGTPRYIARKRYQSLKPPLPKSRME